MSFSCITNAIELGGCGCFARCSCPSREEGAFSALLQVVLALGILLIRSYRLNTYLIVSFVIHIGTPRTGTTVLQKYLFPKSKNYFVVQKRAYATTGQIVDAERGMGGGSIGQCISQMQSLVVPLSDNQATDFLNNLLIPPLLTPSDPLKRSKLKGMQKHALSLGIQILAQTSDALAKTVFLSTERLCDTTASLRCYSRHSKEGEFLIYPLIKAIKEFSGGEAKVTLCLRDPIKYLRSKYIRTFFMRRQFKERDLAPAAYIQTQVALEVGYPGTSALTPAMHAEFIKQLQQYAFVKAFGFQELLASDDVFSLMGLRGEDKYAFQDFPRENKYPITKEQEQAIEVEITQALKQYGFYDQIMKSQMFE